MTSNLLSIGAKGVSIGGDVLSSMISSPSGRRAPAQQAGTGDGDVQLVDMEAARRSRVQSPLPAVRGSKRESKRRGRQKKAGAQEYSPAPGRAGDLGDDFGDDVTVEAVTPVK